MSCFVQARLWHSCLLLAIGSYFGSPALAQSGEQQRAIEIALFGGAHYFQWKEFLRGKRIVKETGPRAVAGLTVGNAGHGKAGFLGEIEGALYGARNVDYDGQTQDGVSIDSDTDYLGGYAEAELGYRVALPVQRQAIDLLGGIGFELWNRDISDTRDDTGRFVRGLEEDYRVIYGRLGVGLFSRWSRWRSHLRVGVKYPLDADVEVSDFNVTLDPNRDLSFFARLQVGWSEGPISRLRLTLHYDSYRFGDSPTEEGRFNGLPVLVFQPESDMDVVGAHLNYAF